MKAVLSFFKKILIDSSVAFWHLAKISIPILVLMKILEPFGVIEFIANLLNPVMGLVGLPGYISLVWAAGLFGNIYAALLVLLSVWSLDPLSIHQANILAIMLLIAHNMVVESLLARKLGSNLTFIVIWRLSLAIIAAWLVNALLTYLNIWQATAVLLLEETHLDSSWGSWIQQQLQTQIIIFFIIIAMIALMDLLRILKLDKYLFTIFSPILMILKLDKNASYSVFVGLILGISYGFAFIHKQLKEKQLTKKEGRVIMNFIAPNHAIIEDTILMIAIGGHLLVILVFRLIFVLLAVFLWLKTKKLRDFCHTKIYSCFK